MKRQYTVISEPSKGKFYPLWRDKEGETWKYFIMLGSRLSFREQYRAQRFVDGLTKLEEKD